MFGRCLSDKARFDVAVALVLALAGTNGCGDDVEPDSASPPEGTTASRSGGPESPSAASALPEAPTAVYFFAPGCPDCEEVERLVLPSVVEGGVRIERVNVEEPAGFDRIHGLQRRHGISAEALAPALLFEGRLLMGPKAIREFFGEASGG